MPFFSRLAAHAKYVSLWLTSQHNDVVHPCTPENTQTDNDVAIYCIHGTADHISAFEFVVKNIQSTLPPEVKSIHRVSFDGRFQLNDIVYFAHQLKNKILANNDKKIILMGHSRGAIVASYFAEYLAKANDIEVEATINICGPFGGTKWAFFPFTYSASIDQMRTDSVFLEYLRQQMVLSPEGSYYYFSGSKDLLGEMKLKSTRKHYLMNGNI